MKDPKILILDEATSSLDSKTEKSIQESLNSISSGRTVLVIAHRLSTIKNADQIIVLKNGKIHEIGNHSQLMEKQGEYFEMWSQQKEHSTEKNEFTNQSQKIEEIIEFN